MTSPHTEKIVQQLFFDSTDAYDRNKIGAGPRKKNSETKINRKFASIICRTRKTKASNVGSDGVDALPPSPPILHRCSGRQCHRSLQSSLSSSSSSSSSSLSSSSLLLELQRPAKIFDQMFPTFYSVRIKI